MTFPALDWIAANRANIAKGLAELAYEEMIKPEETAPGVFEFRTASGLRYRFRAWRTVWDYLRIDPKSLQRIDADGRADDDLEADRFYLDIQAETGMSGITQANFLEELYRTLHADIKTMERQRSFSGLDLSELRDGLLQTLMEGHPKALVAKGRMGWSAADSADYAPESGQSFRLLWLAVRRERLKLGLASHLSEDALYRNCLGDAEYQRLCRMMSEKNLSWDDYALLPVHPWQWNEMIALHFPSDLARGILVPLGVFGDRYQAQISLRTLSDVDHPERSQLKLPLSILNTSCVRGISGHYLEDSPALSETLQSICDQDPILRRTVILREEAGMFFAQEAYHAIEGAPYRYKELLGAIWRESVFARLEPDEKPLLTAALFHKDTGGTSLLSALIRKSGLSPEAWLKAYAATVLVPLYHLQLKYGIGLVAHGQNVMLSLKDHRPHRLILKDFQGDLRIVSDPYPELELLSPKIRALLTKLPPQYLIHDLITGHLVTVMRFVSATLFESEGYAERSFYAALASVVRDYENQQADLGERITKLSLLAPRFARVLVNKVRFQIGYGDSSERPLPLVGTELVNPLHAALNHEV